MSAIVTTANASNVHTNRRVDANALRSRYAKFSPPRLSNPLARPMLFDLLNKLVTARSTIWISAPPGAGKSTLLASYLAYTKMPAIWYTVDEGDNDPASLLGFLAEAVESDSAGTISTSAIYLENLGKTFFDQFYARLPAGSMLVFDDVQDLDWNLAGAILESAIAAAPPEVALCFLSREAPPINFDGRLLRRPLVRIGWSALRLNETESLALAGIPSSESNEKHRDWLHLTGGWAAGVVMLRNGLPDRDSGSETTIPPDALGTAFHYFAAEMLATLTESEQRVLLMLAHMSDWSRMEAVEVTGEVSATALLERAPRGRFICRWRHIIGRLH